MADHFMLMVVGGFFIVLGLALAIWDSKREKGYYNSITGRSDLREFFSHWPARTQFGAWKAGGWISFTIGLILLIMGVIFWQIG